MLLMAVDSGQGSIVLPLFNALRRPEPCGARAAAAASSSPSRCFSPLLCRFPWAPTAEKVLSLRSFLSKVLISSLSRGEPLALSEARSRVGLLWRKHIHAYYNAKLVGIESKSMVTFYPDVAVEYTDYLSKP